MKLHNNRIQFFGATIDRLTMEETLHRVDEIIVSRRITQHVVVNVAKIVLTQEDPKLMDIVNSCGLINADGQGIVWGANLLGCKIPERVAGIDLFINIVRMAAQKGYRLYFLGAKNEVVEKVVNIFKAQYPNLQVAGFRDGYFKANEESGVAAQIKASTSDVLFVAMSSPQKEIFLNKYLIDLNVPFVMGVGGSFDVVAGKTKRAPLWMQKAGLEWFYRFMCEPGRMWKRYFVTNSIYAWMLIKALFNREKYAKVIEN
jgi:N-acetylglucosaminyldiphosphoundecaprenol N-acetyl-beta-D-mannosaminyltransferase